MIFITIGLQLYLACPCLTGCQVAQAINRLIKDFAGKPCHAVSVRNELTISF